MSSHPEAPEIAHFRFQTIALFRELYPTIAKHWGDSSVARKKEDGSLVTNVDPIVEEEIRRVAAEALPDAFFLGEETHKTEPGIDAAISATKRIVIVDPIDGTSEYVHRSSDCGTLVAVFELRHDVLHPLLGLAYRPFLSSSPLAHDHGVVIYSAGNQVFRQILSPRHESAEPISFAEARKPGEMIRVVTPRDIPIPSARVSKIGSSASVADLMHPVLGSAHSAISRSRIWDIAAPIAIASARQIPCWHIASDSQFSTLSFADFELNDPLKKWALLSPIAIGAPYWRA